MVLIDPFLFIIVFLLLVAHLLIKLSDFVLKLRVLFNQRILVVLVLPPFPFHVSLGLINMPLKLSPLVLTFREVTPGVANIDPDVFDDLSVKTCANHTSTF